MFKEQFPVPKIETKEKESVETKRFKLDPEKGTDIVIKEDMSDEKIFVKRKGEGGKDYEHSPAKVIIEKNGNIIEDLEKQVPDGIYFCDSDEIKGSDKWKFIDTGKNSDIKKQWWDPDKKFVTMPKPSEWKSSEDIIFLLHELGHSIRMKKDPKLDNQEMDLMEEIRSMGGRGLTSETEAKNLFKRTIKTIAENERGAWAEGLWLARKLKRDKDIDLLKPFRDRKDKIKWEKIDKVINQSLGTYEALLRTFIKLGISSEELKGIFTKKHKENLRNKVNTFLIKRLIKLQQGKSDKII